MGHFIQYQQRTAKGRFKQQVTKGTQREGVCSLSEQQGAWGHMFTIVIKVGPDVLQPTYESAGFRRKTRTTS